MTKTFIAKPIKVEAFQYGAETQPYWFLQAIRTGKVPVHPTKGTIVAKTEAGQINYYNPKTFNALFCTEEEAQDLDGNGTIDTREKAIASETMKIKNHEPKPLKPETPVAVPKTKPVVEPKPKAEAPVAPKTEELSPQQKAAITRAKNKAKKQQRTGGY